MCTYTIMAQLATSYRQQGLVQTAALVDEVDAQLAERFGPEEEWKVSPRAVAPWLTQLVDELRIRRSYAERGDQYGHTDMGTALGIVVATSVLARAVAEGVLLTPTNAAGMASTIRNEVAKVFEKITASKDNEFRSARVVSEQKWQESRRAVLGQKERDRKIAELEMTKARLEQSLAQ